MVWHRALSTALAVALALLMAVAVPVACHHTNAQPLFLASLHDHGTHDHAHATPIGEPTIGPTGVPCIACVYHVPPHPVSELTAPYAVLPPTLLLSALWAQRPAAALAAPSPLSVSLPRAVPPPRAALLPTPA